MADTKSAGLLVLVSSLPIPPAVLLSKNSLLKSFTSSRSCTYKSLVLIANILVVSNGPNESIEIIESKTLPNINLYGAFLECQCDWILSFIPLFDILLKEGILLIFTFTYCATYEYLPSKAFNNKDYIALRTQEPIIQDGNCIIEQSVKDKLAITFNIREVQEETKIELPFIYYLGYEADLNGKRLEISESENGFIQITIPKGEEGKIHAKYVGTKIYYAAFVISIIGAISLISYIVIYEIKLRKEK